MINCDKLSYSAITIFVYRFVLVPWARNTEDAFLIIEIINLGAFSILPWKYVGKELLVLFFILVGAGEFEY